MKPNTLGNVFLVLLSLLLNFQLDAQRVRELYIDEVPNIISDSARARMLIKHIEAYDINQLNIFRFYEYYQDSTFQHFLETAKDAGIRKVSVGFPINYFELSDEDRLALLEKSRVESLTFENDFWVQGSAEETFEMINQLTKRKQQDQVNLRMYFGWFGQDLDDNIMALHMVKTFDEILIHHYAPGANFEYVKDRLLRLGLAAMRNGKRQKIVLKISVHPSFFEAMNPEIMDEVYKQLKADFKAAAKEHKELRFIKLQGWQLYNSRYLES
jgi:hypothetical protein